MFTQRRSKETVIGPRICRRIFWPKLHIQEEGPDMNFTGFIAIYHLIERRYGNLLKNLICPAGICYLNKFNQWGFLYLAILYAKFYWVKIKSVSKLLNICPVIYYWCYFASMARAKQRPPLSPGKGRPALVTCKGDKREGRENYIKNVCIFKTNFIFTQLTFAYWMARCNEPHWLKILEYHILAWKVITGQ